MGPMKITLLGTGSPIPDSNRAGPATLVETDDAKLLVDCGRGVLMRLTAAGVVPPMLHAVLVTHLHSDHITDLNDVVTTHWVMCPGPVTLHLYGPPGLQEVVNGMLAMLGPDMKYRMDHHDDLKWRPQLEVHEVAPGDFFEIGATKVLVGQTNHKPVEPTVAFRVEAGGKSVVLGGDGVPCDGLDEICADADAYVQTVLREDFVKLVPNPRFNEILDYHSSVEQAAQTAKRAGVKTLVLTHYIPMLMPGAEDEWRAIAAAHFDGPIVLGDDLTTLEL
jgi:ribonuclease Z